MSAHFTYADILNAPSTKRDEHYRRVVIKLQPGDVAASCTSTKWDLRALDGGATIEYLIAPFGITVTVIDGEVCRHYRSND